jgi:hypothetical protein
MGVKCVTFAGRHTSSSAIKPSNYLFAFKFKMRKISRVFHAGIFLLAFPALSVYSQQSLPDAPQNHLPGKWSDVVEPGEKIPPLSAKDKLMFPAHEELRLTGWFSTFLSAGWDQLTDGNPKYGSDSGAFGERLGAAALRDLSMRTFSDGVLPALLREDPRYFRKRDGSIVHRGVYAASRVFVDQRDNGSSGFNNSVVLGHGMASALTMAWYPDESAKPSVVFETWAWSLLGEAGGNLWSEFWPDVRGKIFHRHRNAQP